MQGPRLRLPGCQLRLLAAKLPLEVLQNIWQTAVVFTKPASTRALLSTELPVHGRCCTLMLPQQPSSLNSCIASVLECAPMMLE